MMKKKLALALVLVMLFAVAGPALAADYPYSRIITEIENLQASGKQSNNLVDHSVIDLAYIKDNGSVVSYTYIGDKEELTINKFTVTPQNFSPDSTNKLTRFIFELTNRYRPDTDLAISIDRDKQSVHAYTYGALKHEAMYAIISGTPDCLNNEPYVKDRRSSGGGGSWVDKYNPEETTKAPITSFDVTTTKFTLDSSAYTVSSTTGDSFTKTMDVKPLVKDERTFVPIRYLAYALGATEDDVHWDGTTQTVTLEFEDATEVLALGSQTLLVDGDPVAMDVAPFAESGRTFLPARWIAEPLGAQVDWDAVTQEVTITTEREIEQE